MEEDVEEIINNQNCDDEQVKIRKFTFWGRCESNYFYDRMLSKVNYIIFTMVCFFGALLFGGEVIWALIWVIVSIVWLIYAIVKSKRGPNYST